MSKREIEGDWVMGWPDRKRPVLIAGKDTEGRVISGRTPILEQEGLITPTNGYYVVTHFRTASDKLPEFERLLKLDDDLLRYLIVVNEGDLSTSPAPIVEPGDDEDSDDEEE